MTALHPCPAPEPGETGGRKVRAGKRGGALWGGKGGAGRAAGGRGLALQRQSGPAPRCPQRPAIGEARCPSSPAAAQRTSSAREGSGSESGAALGAGGLRRDPEPTRSEALGPRLTACSHDSSSLSLSLAPGSLISHTVARSCWRADRCTLVALGALSHSLPRSWEQPTPVQTGGVCWSSPRRRRCCPPLWPWPGGAQGRASWGRPGASVSVCGCCWCCCSWGRLGASGTRRSGAATPSASPCARIWATT